MRKRVISFIIMLAVTASGILMYGCGSKQDDETSDDFVLEADSYDMADQEESLYDKLLSTALSGIGSGISNGISGVVSDISTWAAEGIIKSMGFSYYGENSYKQEVLGRLQNIESGIVSLENKVDWLTSTYSDHQYLATYQDFVKDYKKISTTVAVPYSLLLTSEENIKEGTEKNINSDLEAICSEIEGVSTTRSKLDEEVTDFGNYFIGSATSVSKLQTYSIFNIAERFVSTQTPYIENQYRKYTEIIADPYSTYYIAVSLVVLDYTKTLNEYGITKYWLDEEGNMIAYRVSEGDKVYINCRASQKSAFADKYNSLITDVDLNECEAQTINNYNAKAYMTAGYLANITKQYNAINKLFTEFIQKYTTSAENNYVNLTALGQKASLTVKTLAPSDFIEDDGNGKFGIKYGKFGNISKKDFIAYAKEIESYAVESNSDGSKKNLTFREFFEREGFKFPKNNQSSYLLLGAEKGKSDYSDWYNNGYKYENCIAVCTVDLNMKISDFVKNQTFSKVYYAKYVDKINVNSNCGPKYGEKQYVMESLSEGSGRDFVRGMKIADGLNKSWKTDGGAWTSPVIYYTIDGLSSSPKTGTSYSLTF